MSRPPHFLDSQLKVGSEEVSLMHQISLTPKTIPDTHFCYRLSLHQGHSAAGRIIDLLKNPMTSSGIKPVTFHPVAQSLNKLR
jgi:hypothetical protein